MENQHKEIKGYRDLSADEIALMNRVKAAGNELGAVIKELENAFGLDQRFVALGKTNVQTGLMLLIRSIAQPTTFC